jgi:hypothetical protein
VLAKEEMFSTFMGFLLKAFQCIPVDRFGKDSNHCIELITQRVKNKRLPPLLIFPEGTTKAPKFLLKFKSGAFRGGHPVNPVVLSFMNSRSYATQEFFGNFHDLYNPLCNFINFIRVDILPLYEPLANEVKDHKLYAENVRAVMLETMKKYRNDSALSQKSIEDRKIEWKLEKLTADLNLEAEQMIFFKNKLGKLSAEKIFYETGLKTKQITSRLCLFLELVLNSSNENFHLHIDDIVRLSKNKLNKPQVVQICRFIIPKLRELISPMDFLIISSFVEGTKVAAITKELNQLKIIFSCIDRDQCGVLTIEDITTFMCDRQISANLLEGDVRFDERTHAVFEEKLRILFRNADTDQINFEEFVTLLKGSIEIFKLLLGKARIILLAVLMKEAPVFVAENNTVDKLLDSFWMDSTRLD